MLNVKAEMTKDPFFELIASLNIDFMEMSFADNSAEFWPKPHAHHWFDISYVMKGTVHYEIEGEHYDVSEGQMVIVAPGRVHRETAPPHTHYEVMFLCLTFSRDGQPFDLAAYMGIKEVHYVSRKKEIQHIFEQILQEISERREGYLLKLNAYIYQLLAEIRRGRERILEQPEIMEASVHLRKEKLIHDIKRYIEAHLERKITLKQLSETFFLSVPYLSSLFKKHTGCSPIEYINRCKIEKAKALLLTGNAVAEVSEQAGFGDVHYFYKVFKQVENMTPIQFLKKESARQEKIE